VKHHHPEKTRHPCQFPIALVERFVLACSAPDDLVVDPYMGVGSTLCAAVLHGRRGGGSEIDAGYLAEARARVAAALAGTLAYRPLARPFAPAVGAPAPALALGGGA
jgi:adenine-specific DNA-methyltransferase